MIYKYYKYQNGGSTRPDIAATFTENGQANPLTDPQKKFVWKKGSNRVGQVDTAIDFLGGRGLYNIKQKSNVAGGNANVYGSRYAGAAYDIQHMMNNNQQFKDWYAKNGGTGTGDTWQDLKEDGYWGDNTQKMFEKYKTFLSQNDNPTTQSNPTQASNPTYASPYKAFDYSKYSQQLGSTKQFAQGWKDYFSDFNALGRKNWNNSGRYQDLVDKIGQSDAGMAQYLRDKYQNIDGTWKTDDWRKDFGRNFGWHNYKDLIRDYSMYAANRNANAKRALDTWNNNPETRNINSFKTVAGLTPGKIYFSNDEDDYKDMYSTDKVDWSKGNGVGLNGKQYTTARWVDDNGQMITKRWDSANNKWGDSQFGETLRYDSNNIVSPIQNKNSNYNSVFTYNKFGGQLMYKYQNGGDMPQQSNAGTGDDMQQQVEQLVQAAMSGDGEANKVIQSIQEAAQQGDQQAAQMMEIIQSVAQQMQQGQAPVSAKYGAKLNYIARLRGECPDGYHMEYFKAGGRICKKCQKDIQRAARKEKIEKKACGGATKSMNKIKSQMKSKKK